jgi:predicted permease
VFWSRHRPSEDFDAEILSHIEIEADRLIQEGMSREAAVAAARRTFGNVTRSQERFYETSRWVWLDGVTRDLRHAMRRLAGEPKFTSTALATLALCIGANVTIFAVVDAILLRPLPFPNAERLVRLFNTYPAAGIQSDASSFTNYYERRDTIGAFAGLAIYYSRRAIVGEAGSTEHEDVLLVSPDFFSTLGAAPAMGRVFTDEEMTFQTDDVVILTDEYWRQRLNADPHVLGREVRVDGSEKTVVGVLSSSFRFLSFTPQLYLPLSSDPSVRGPNHRYNGSMAEMIARLEPGVSLTAAQAEVDAHNAAMEASGPFAQFTRMTEMGFRTLVVPLHADHVKTVRPALLLLQGGVLFLLLIGGVNLVNLLLIRVGGRHREFAIRQALGARRRDVARQVVLETVLLVVSGGLLGVLASVSGVTLFTRLGARRLPLGDLIALDGRVMVIAVLGSLVVGLVLAAPLVWFSVRRASATVLRTESRGGTASLATQRLRHGFTVAQIAFAFVLLTGAGVLGLSLARVLDTSPGFDASQLLTGRLPLSDRTTADALAFLERLAPAIQQQPGVASVAFSTAMPFGERAISGSITVEGAAQDDGSPRRAHYRYGVVGDYWKVMSIPLREGRVFANTREPYVCVVDEDFARRYWPNGRAVGRRLSHGPVFNAAHAATIVGVVGSVKQHNMADIEALGTVYFPYATYNSRDVAVLVRSTLAPAALAPALRATVRQLAAELPVDDLKPMQIRIDESLVTRRSLAALVAIFAGVALLLASIGTYGVLAYSVEQRRREIGVRLALGALPIEVLMQFLRVGTSLLLVGLSLGSLGAWGLGRAMESLLFGVGPSDVSVLAATSAVITVIVLFATLIPSQRAARLSPVAALSEQ